MMNNQTQTELKELQFSVIRQAVGYGRVSTDDQADYGTSLESQRKAIETYAVKNDIPLVAYFEDDYTGRKLDRPGLKQVRQCLRDGLANCLIAYKPDRLSRHRTHIMMLVDELLDQDCELHLVTKGHINLADNTQVLMLSIEGHISHGEVDTITERMTNGRREKADKGQIMGWKAPYGYRIEKITTTTENGRIIVTARRLVIDPIEAAIVREIYELLVYKDYSMNSIARYLNRKGLRYRTGSKWTSFHISRIIPGEVYKGIYSYVGIVTEVEPIISSELWERAQEKKEYSRKHRRWNKTNYLLTGRTTCFHCGRHITGTTSGAQGNRYYRCACAYKTSDYYQENDIPCPNRHFFRADLVDRALLEWLYKALTDEKTLEKGLADYTEKQKQKYQPLMDDLARVEKLLKKKQAAKTRLVDAYLDGVFDKETVQARKLQLEAEIKSAIEEKTSLEARLEAIAKLPQKVKDIGELRQKVDIAFTKMSLARQRELLELLEAECKIEWDKGEWWLHIESAIGSTLLQSSIFLN